MNPGPLKPFVFAGHPDPKKALAVVAQSILSIRRRQVMAVAQTNAMWKQYLLECKVHGVEPTKEVFPDAPGLEGLPQAVPANHPDGKKA